MRLLGRLAAATFGLVLAALIPFWAIRGTHPAGDAVLLVLYALLGASAVLWLVAALLRRLRRNEDRDPPVAVYVRPIIFNVTIIEQIRPVDTPPGAPESASDDAEDVGEG